MTKLVHKWKQYRISREREIKTLVGLTIDLFKSWVCHRIKLSNVFVFFFFKWISSSYSLYYLQSFESLFRLRLDWINLWGKKRVTQLEKTKYESFYNQLELTYIAMALLFQPYCGVSWHKSTRHEVRRFNQDHKVNSVAFEKIPLQKCQVKLSLTQRSFPKLTDTRNWSSWWWRWSYSS